MTQIDRIDRVMIQLQYCNLFFNPFDIGIGPFTGNTLLRYIEGQENSDDSHRD